MQMTGAESGERGVGEPHDISGIKFCWWPPGQFVMGSPPTERERRLDEDQAQVTLTRGSWICRFDVIQSNQ